MWQGIQNTYQVLADKHSYQSSKGLNFHFIPGYPEACHFSIFRASWETVEFRKGRLWGRAGLMVRTGLLLPEFWARGTARHRPLLLRNKGPRVGVRVWVVEGECEVKMPFAIQMQANRFRNSLPEYGAGSVKGRHQLDN